MRASHRQFDTRALPSIVRRSGLWGWITTAPITILSCLVQRLPRRFGEPEHSHHQRHGDHCHSVPEAGEGIAGPGDDGLADEGQESTEIAGADMIGNRRSEEHTSELQSLMRISYAVFCLKKNKHKD